MGFYFNIGGTTFSTLPNCSRSTCCRDYDCPMGYEAFCHEIGEDCLLDPKEVWKLSPIDIILKPDAAKAYREAEAALAEAKEKKPELVHEQGLDL